MGNGPSLSRGSIMAELLKYQSIEKVDKISINEK
jgi:hypothetical protein